MSEQIVEVDGRKILVRRRGNGAPVVLLHGFPQTGHAWEAVADKLSGRSRVLVPDLPGFGRSDPATSSDASTVASLLVSALEQAGAEKFALVGHDWGGSIALRMALDHPERVERLVVVNAPFRTLDLRRAWHLLAFNVPLVPEAMLTLFGRQLVPWMIRLAATNKQAFDDDSMREYSESLSDMRHARSTMAYYRTITRPWITRRVRSALGLLPVAGRFLGGDDASDGGDASERRRIEVPTLIVWGESDPFLPPSLIEGIERDVADATVVRLPDVGHFVPEEAPGELAHEIDRFLYPAH